MSSLFTSFLQSIPYKTRSELVNELDLPDDITAEPYVLRDRNSFTTDSLLSLPIYSPLLDDVSYGTLSSDSSLALSRAMTDSDIDYERFRRLKNIPVTDPWHDMRVALDSFPRGYLSSLDNYLFSSYPTGTLYETYEKAKQGWLHDAELRARMERFFEEECRVYGADDPGLMALEDALLDVDYSFYEGNFNSMERFWNSTKNYYRVKQYWQAKFRTQASQECVRGTDVGGDEAQLRRCTCVRASFLAHDPKSSETVTASFPPTSVTPQARNT